MDNGNNQFPHWQQLVPKPGVRSKARAKQSILERFVERHCYRIEEKNVAELIIKYASLRPSIFALHQCSPITGEEPVDAD